MKVLQYIVIVGFIAIPFMGFAQKDRKYIREGNKHFKSQKFDNSEVSYRKASELSKDGFLADFNSGDALFRQEKYEEAGKSFERLAGKDSDKLTKSNVYHNLGNSFLLNQKLEESIEAYKNALRNNPWDYDTKYNLAYAQNLLKQQQQQEQQDQNQDKKDNKEDKEDQNKDQQNKDQENKDQEDKEQQNKEQNKDQQPQPQKISKEDARRLLEALANDEKKVQEKVKKAKALQQKVRTLKEW